MPIATVPTVVPTRTFTVAKMEDRKRSAIADTDEYAPPSKRQAVNGSAGKAKEDPNGEFRDEAWLEVSHFLARHWKFRISTSQTAQRSRP